jgi:hypothetical protein
MIVWLSEQGCQGPPSHGGMSVCLSPVHLSLCPLGTGSRELVGNVGRVADEQAKHGRHARFERRLPCRRQHADQLHRQRRVDEHVGHVGVAAEALKVRKNVDLRGRQHALLCRVEGLTWELQELQETLNNLKTLRRVRSRDPVTLNLKGPAHGQPGRRRGHLLGIVG